MVFSADVQHVEVSVMNFNFIFSVTIENLKVTLTELFSAVRPHPRKVGFTHVENINCYHFLVSI